MSESRQSRAAASTRLTALIALLVMVAATTGCIEATVRQKLDSFEPLAGAEVRGESLYDAVHARTALLYGGLDVVAVTEANGARRFRYTAPVGVTRARLSQACAVAVSPDGYFVTVAHAVDSDPLILAVRQPGEEDLTVAPARVVWRHPKRDLALLHADVLPATWFGWAEDDAVREGLAVMLDGLLEPAAGQIERAATLEHDAPPVTWVAHSAPSRRGDSGGPLVDPAGRLLGVTVGTWFDLPFFQPVSLALRPDVNALQRAIAADRLVRAGPAPTIAARH